MKSAEGVAEAVNKILKQEINKSFLSKIGALLMINAFKTLKKRIHYEEYGGAPLLGVNNNIIICHGKSSARAIECAIYQAINSIESNIIEKITNGFSKY